MPLLLRTAALADLDGIHGIEQREFAHLAYPYFALRQLFDLSGAQWVVADVDGVLSGYAMVGMTQAGGAWLLGLAVDRAARGRGYASALLHRVLAQCSTSGAHTVRITVRPTNQWAYALYRQAGFTRTTHEERYFGPDEPRDVLTRRLAAEGEVG